MKQILLVEDDPFLIDIYTQKLKESGFDLMVAKSADEVFERLREKKPDLIILDIVLPGADGWEILKKIKSNPDLNSVKVIILSNLSQQDQVERGLKLGALKYLIKAHYTPSGIVKEIKELLQ